MKRFCSSFICVLICTLSFAILILPVSCDGRGRIDTYEESYEEAKYLKLSVHGESVTLSGSSAECIWYECSNASGSIANQVSTGQSFTTPVFEEPGLKYYVYKENNETSKVFTVFYTGLPAVFIDTEKEITNKITEIDGNVRVVKADGTEESNLSAQIRGRGNSSWFSTAKKSYKIKYENKQSLLGLSKSKTWVILASPFDPSLLGNRYAGWLRKNIFCNDWNSSYEFADVIYNGIYMGNYCVAENIKTGKNRVNIQDLSELSKDVNGDGTIDIKDGGFILEVGVKRDGAFPFSSKYGVPMVLGEPDPDEFDPSVSTREAEFYIKNIVWKTERAIYDLSSDSWKEYFDLDSFVDWYLTNEFMTINDARLHQSVYMFYNPADGKIHMGPCWDFDHWVNADKINKLVVSSQSSEWVKELMKRPEVRNAVTTRWNEKKAALLESFEFFSQEADKITVSATANRIRWNITGDFSSSVSAKLILMNARYTYLDTTFNSSPFTDNT